MAFLCLSLSKARSAGFFSEEEMKERDPQPWTERRGHIMVIINLGVLTYLTYLRYLTCLTFLTDHQSGSFNIFN